MVPVPPDTVALSVRLPLRQVELMLGIVTTGSATIENVFTAVVAELPQASVTTHA